MSITFQKVLDIAESPLEGLEEGLFDIIRLPRMNRPEGQR